MEADWAFQKIRDLNLPEGKFALFGSAPLAARGLKDEIGGIDVIVREDVWSEYALKKEWETKTTPRTDAYLVNGVIELWKNWWPGQWDIGKLIEEADMIDGLPFVKLEKVLEWKTLYGREKDIEDAKVIARFLSGRP